MSKDFLTVLITFFLFLFFIFCGLTISAAIIKIVLGLFGITLTWLQSYGIILLLGIARRVFQVSVKVKT